MRRLAHYVFYAFCGGLIVLFLIGYAARYVHPRYAWWAELIAIGLPYLSLILVGTALGAGLLRAWRLLLAHAFVLGLIVLRFGLPFPLQSEEAGPEPLRVMTYNVPRWGSPSEEEKTERLSALVRRTEPHLLALQEAYVSFDASGILARGTRPYVEGLATAPLNYRLAQAQTDGRTQQPVLGRIPLFDLSQQTLRLGSTKEDITYVVRTGFEWQGRRAVLYNVHLRTFGSDKPWRAENPQLFDIDFWRPYLQQYRRAYRARAREVVHIRDMLEKETLPVIVAGDFNSTPHSWAYRQLAKDMQDVFHLTGSGWGSTYHARLPFARIDFILASEEWEVVDARLPEADLSDHRPLLAMLRWKEKGGG